MASDLAKRGLQSLNEVRGIGVSVPGLVDCRTGRAIYYIPHFKWRDWPIAEALVAASGLERVVVDNDANAAALAELWFGRAETQKARDFASKTTITRA